MIISAFAFIYNKVKFTSIKSVFIDRITQKILINIITGGSYVRPQISIHLCKKIFEIC